jgi:hypothetical protein
MTDAPDYAAMSDDELRAILTEREGKKPHPATGRDKLLARVGDTAPDAEPDQELATEAETTEAEQAPAPVLEAEAEPEADLTIGEDLAQDASEQQATQSLLVRQAVLDQIDLRVSEFVPFLRGELGQFGGDADAAVAYVAHALRSAL